MRLGRIPTLTSNSTALNDVTSNSSRESFASSQRRQEGRTVRENDSYALTSTNERRDPATQPIPQHPGKHETRPGLTKQQTREMGALLAMLEIPAKERDALTGELHAIKERQHRSPRVLRPQSGTRARRLDSSTWRRHTAAFGIMLHTGN